MLAFQLAPGVERIPCLKAEVAHLGLVRCALRTSVVPRRPPQLNIIRRSTRGNNINFDMRDSSQIEIANDNTERQLRRGPYTMLSLVPFDTICERLSCLKGSWSSSRPRLRLEKRQ
jgi:hypothetical protein